MEEDSESCSSPPTPSISPVCPFSSCFRPMRERKRKRKLNAFFFSSEKFRGLERLFLLRLLVDDLAVCLKRRDRSKNKQREEERGGKATFFLFCSSFCSTFFCLFFLRQRQKKFSESVEFCRRRDRGIETSKQTKLLEKERNEFAPTRFLLRNASFDIVLELLSSTCAKECRCFLNSRRHESDEIRNVVAIDTIDLFAVVDASSSTSSSSPTSLRRRFYFFSFTLFLFIFCEETKNPPRRQRRRRRRRRGDRRALVRPLAAPLAIEPQRHARRGRAGDGRRRQLR